MSFLQHRSKRQGFDGWALRIKGAVKPLDWTTCTTREEVHELRRTKFPELDFFNQTEIVKVRILVELVE